MRCSKCHRDLPETEEHWYFTAGRRMGCVCRYCKSQASKNHYRHKSLCKHCGKPILNRTKKASYHIDPEHPECYEAYLEHFRDVQRLNRKREASRRVCEERKDGRLAYNRKRRNSANPKCRICGKPLPDGYHWNCPGCLSRKANEFMCEGDFIYF